ncbi:MAG: hypothetical protein E7614_04805 [Ruminococcaceae bacterium]|nr:hypothetical protein [Oscillospiraceae bacterium]
MFRKKRGINLSYPMQGFVCFSCLTYDAQPKTVKNKINKLCDEIGGEFRDALFEFVTTEKTVTEISLKHYVSETKLYNMRKKFYESWRM